MGFEFQMGRELVVDAYQHGMTVSAWLEHLDPTNRYAPHEQMCDAFERQLMRYDIRSASDPRSGVPADTCGRFFEEDENGTREERSSLFPEFVSRIYRELSTVYPRNRYGRATGNWNRKQQTFTDGARFPLGDVPVSFSLYPAAAAEEFRYQQLAPSALNALIARTRMITGEDFRALYLNDSTGPGIARMARVEEYAELPTARFDAGENAIKVKKYGRRLQVSYEAVRRMSIDMLAWAISYIAAKADCDKEATAIDVLINGDGNTGTAATSTNGSTLDAGAAGNLTLKMWTGFRYLWAAPYASNVVCGTTAALTLLLLLQAGSANVAPWFLASANIPDLHTIRPVRQTFEGMLAVDNAVVTANNLLALDGNWTLELVSEVGADIVETDRVISAQFNEIAISETVGFCVATKGVNRMLAYTA